jgi:hypothetical protein
VSAGELRQRADVPLHQHQTHGCPRPTPNKNTLALNGASGNLVTADGGKTWTVDDITINQYTYT